MRPAWQFLGKLAYAIIFLFLVPAGLLVWSSNVEHLVRWPAVGSPGIGWVLVTGGTLHILWGMQALITYGKGLPMNAYPPTLFVKRGPYKIVRHPIYWGFAFLLLGIFILLRSAGGIWLVTPVTILGMVALVWGYERIKLAERFPGQTLTTIFDLPPHTIDTPQLRDRLASLFRVASILGLGNLLIVKLVGGFPPAYGAPLGIFPDQHQLLLVMVSVAFLIMVPFSIKNKSVLHQWAMASSIALGLNTFIAFLSPPIGAQYLMTGGFELVSVPIVLWMLSVFFIWKTSRTRGIFFGIFGLFLSGVQLIYCRSAELHIGFAISVFGLTANYQGIWRFLQHSTEQVANSWKEWVFGKVRVINHGFYVGFGAFFGILLASLFTGPAYAWSILVFAITVIVFSAIWAQVIEGSEKLKRPFGYYGALVGTIFASLIVWAMGKNVWVLIGAISVVMPWVQAIGRARCLVNGCCHGRKTENPDIGIRYFHHRSRVCNISHLKGELLHPTPLYAMLWLALVGFVLMGFWLNRFSAPFIFGMYLILTGTGRFVEEAYRGEVQTPIIKGLRIYQWLAILSVIIGIVITTIQVEPIILIPESSWETILVAVLGGLFTFVVMGVDLPYSTARFSRLV